MVGSFQTSSANICFLLLLRKVFKLKWLCDCVLYDMNTSVSITFLKN